MFLITVLKFSIYLYYISNLSNYLYNVGCSVNQFFHCRGFCDIVRSYFCFCFWRNFKENGRRSSVCIFLFCSTKLRCIILCYLSYFMLCFFHYCLSTELQHTYHIQLNMDDELQFAKTNSYCVICYSMMIH